jgi:hypothetical protein
MIRDRFAVVMLLQVLGRHVQGFGQLARFTPKILIRRLWTFSAKKQSPT